MSLIILKMSLIIYVCSMVLKDTRCRSDEESNHLLSLWLHIVQVVKVDSLEVDKLRAISWSSEASVTGVHGVSEVHSGSKDDITVVLVLGVVLDVPVVVDGVGVVSGVFNLLVISIGLVDVVGL